MHYIRLCYFIVSFIFVILINVSKAQVDILKYYKSVINSGIEDALNFSSPVDARGHKPQNDTIYDYGTYDFVIIGGGVTGSIIAHRLSEIKSWKILLIEAGDFSDGDFIQFPAYFNYHAMSRYNWAYTSVPQKNSCLGFPNESCIIPVGKGVGGSSLINGLLYCRGPPNSYNDLAKMVNDSSWDYRNMLPYFKKTESFHQTNMKAPIDRPYHNSIGLLQVEHRSPDHNLTNLFINANSELGYQPTDYSGPNILGTSYLQWFTKYGRREDFGSIFITPYLGRENLDVAINSYVTKIEINEDTKVAESVLFTKYGNTYRARATKEIILSAGTIASSQILLLSGVGPEEHLKSFNINVVKDLSVGSIYRDHPFTNHLIFSTNFTINETSLDEQLSDYLLGRGELTSPVAPQGVGFYQHGTKVGGIPDFEIFWDLDRKSTTSRALSGLNDATYNALWGKHHDVGVKFTLVYLNTHSVGSVRLRSSSPYDYPLINPNMLSDDKNEDIEGMYQGLQFIFKLAETDTLKTYNFTYVGEPLPACKTHRFKSKDYWYCFLKQLSLPGYHQVGTCAMGSESGVGAVVDTNLKVFGIENLRVADCSIFPVPLAAHTTIPCSTIGEKISDTIKIQYLSRNDY